MFTSMCTYTTLKFILYTYAIYLNIDQWFHTAFYNTITIKVNVIFSGLFSTTNDWHCEYPSTRLSQVSNRVINDGWNLSQEAKKLKTSRVDLMYLRWTLNMVPGKWWFGNWTWSLCFVVLALLSTVERNVFFGLCEIVLLETHTLGLKKGVCKNLLPWDHEIHQQSTAGSKRTKTPQSFFTSLAKPWIPLSNTMWHL